MLKSQKLFTVKDVVRKFFDESVDKLQSEKRRGRVRREPGRVDRHREHAGNDDVGDAGHAAFCRNAVFEGESAGIVVHAASEHETERALDRTNRQNRLAGQWIDASVCQTGRHDALDFCRYLKQFIEDRN
jgi:hypothetical protein